MNVLIKKYKECVDHNSKSGRSPKIFPYFNEMQDMFGHRKNINCDHTLGSSLFRAKSEGSNYLKSEDLQQLSETQIPPPSSSRKVSSPRKVSSSRQVSPPRQVLPPRQVSSPRQLTSPVEKVKKVHNGSATYVAKTKLELEKQWLEHLRMLSTKNEKENEKLIRIDKRNALKKEKLLLKQKQALWKETALKRKLENKEEQHRERMRIEREKCQLLKDLIQSKNQFSFDNIINDKKNNLI